MTAYDNDVNDALRIILDTLDAVTDRRERAALLARTRRSTNDALDLRLFRLMHELHEDGVRQADIAAAVGMSPRTVGQWLEKYRTMTGLPSRSRAGVDDLLAEAIEIDAGFKG